MTEPEKQLQPVPPHTEEQLQKFVEDVLANQIIMLQDLPPNPDIARSVFLALSFGVGAEFDPTTLGTIYEYFSEAGPTSISMPHEGKHYSYPSFLSCRFMNRDDWQRVRPILLEAFEKRDREAELRKEALKAAFITTITEK